MNTVEEIREAVEAAHAATTRLTTLYGPLWHLTHYAIDDGMVARAAEAMYAAYQPDEDDDLTKCWQEAMRYALEAALTIDSGRSEGTDD